MHLTTNLINLELIPEIDKETKVKTKDPKEFDKTKVSDSEIDSDLFNEFDKIAHPLETETGKIDDAVNDSSATHYKLHFEAPQKSEKDLEDTDQACSRLRIIWIYWLRRAI